MEGNSKFAPSFNKTSSASGPVLTAIVKIPASTAALTPNGAFSITIASFGCKFPF